MEQENAENLASFIKDAEHFREFCQRAIKSQQYNADAIQSDAMVLYDKYFSMQATNSLKFDDSIRFDVENEICREGGPTPDCFDKPVRLVLQKLQNVRKNFIFPIIFLFFHFSFRNIFQSIYEACIMYSTCPK